MNRLKNKQFDSLSIWLLYFVLFVQRNHKKSYSNGAQLLSAAGPSVLPGLSGHAHSIYMHSSTT